MESEDEFNQEFLENPISDISAESTKRTSLSIIIDDSSENADNLNCEHTTNRGTTISILMDEKNEINFNYKVKVFPL